MEIFSLFHQPLPSHFIPCPSEAACHPGLIQCLKYHPDNPIICPGVPRVQCAWVRPSPHLSSSPESNLLIHFSSPPTVTSPPYPTAAAAPTGGEIFIVLCLPATISAPRFILIKPKLWESRAKPPKYLTICPTVCHGQSSPVFAQNLWQVSPNLIFLRTKGGP